MAEEAISPARGLARIPAGTPIAHGGSGHWNRIVLLARPRISSGDVDSLSDAVRNSISQFVLTIVASVDQVEDPATGKSRFRLAEVGAAYSLRIDTELRTVTAADLAASGVKLDWFDRTVLAENERQLETIRVVARSSTLMIFDVPAIMLRNAQHREYSMRHFIWIDPRTGRNAALIWLIEPAAGGRDGLAEGAARWVPAATEEDRAIHVDGSQFNILGVPNKSAFAVEDLPPGRDLPWTPQAREVAALRQFDAQSLHKLASALQEMLQSGFPG